MYGSNDMPYPEFCKLLKGISNKTPLGNVVSIRAENDKDILKHFSPEQHKIRNDWRSRSFTQKNITELDKQEATEEIQKVFANIFGAGKIPQ